MFRYLTFLIISLATLFLSGTADAHPRKESETEITFNEQTQKTEIVSKFRVVDAEDVIQKVYGDGLDLIKSPKVQFAFGYYVQDNFFLSQDGKKLSTEMVGAEIRDGALWVYQEASPLPVNARYILRFPAMMETYPQQVNQVNIRLHDQVKSFPIYRQSSWVSFDFKTPEK